MSAYFCHWASTEHMLVAALRRQLLKLANKLDSGKSMETGGLSGRMLCCLFLRVGCTSGSSSLICMCFYTEGYRVLSRCCSFSAYSMTVNPRILLMCCSGPSVYVRTYVCMCSSLMRGVESDFQFIVWCSRKPAWVLYGAIQTQWDNWFCV